MAVTNFSDLLKHKGHAVEVSTYEDEEQARNVAIECTDCMEVLLDFDNPKFE